MNEHNEPFSPQRVDESIEEILTTGQPHLPGQRSEDVNVRLVQDLQRVYDPEFTRYQQVLQRVEDRLVEQRITRAASRPPLRPLPIPQEPALLQAQHIQRGNRKNIMDDKKSGLRRYERPLSLLVAVVILAVLVGGFFVAQRRFAQLGASGPNNPKAVASSTPKPALSPTPLHVGQTLTTIPGDQMGFQGAVWSNDSQRIAAATGYGIKIADAVTGKVLLTVKLPGANEFPYSLDWSPNSQLLAIGTNQELHIVDGRSGAIVRSYTTPLTRTTAPGAMSSLVGGSHYSSLFPSSGGWGFRAVSWSPDGRSIAASVSSGPSGSVQVLNAQNATVDYTLPIDGSNVPGEFSWSSDGQYLASDVSSTQGGDPMNSSMIWVWKLSNRSVVFKQVGGGNPGSLAFQPKTHNLAFNKLTMNAPAVIQVWSVETDKMVTSYTGTYLMTWSPDGQQLAYNGFKQLGKNSYEANVTVVDANSGKVVNVIKESNGQISQLAWSPNGKYMFTIETSTTAGKGTPPTIQDMRTVIRVWTIV